MRNKNWIAGWGDSVLEQFTQNLNCDIDELEEMVKISPENYSFYDLEKNEATITPESFISIKFHSNDIKFNENDGIQYDLRIIGEVDIDPEYRCEAKFPIYYRMINDCLIVCESGNYLAIPCNNETNERGFYHKFDANVQDCLDLKFGIEVRGSDLEFKEDSVIELTAEIYYKDNFKRNYYDPCDEFYRIDLIQNITNKYQLFFTDIPNNKNIEFIMLHFNVKKVKGLLYVKSPFISTMDFTRLTPDFSPSCLEDERVDWIGDCISQKEWPEFEIKLNGEMVFCGKLFQPIYRWPASQVKIRKDNFIEGINKLTIKLIDSYTNTLDFHLRNIEFVLHQRGFAVLAYPRYVDKDGEFSVLLNTPFTNNEIFITTEKNSIKIISDKHFYPKTEINYLRFRAEKIDTNVPILIKSGHHEKLIIIKRIVEKQGGIILTGTGDSVYINQNINDYNKFMIWYLNNQIGNFITFRPVYRWGGSYESCKLLWDSLIITCQDMDICYVHMVDGRELNGCNANPEKQWLESSRFLGNQCHEKDGSYYYWGSSSVSEAEKFYLMLFSRKMKWYGINPPKAPAYNQSGITKYINPHVASDMKSGAEYLISNFSEICGKVDRHTGPSTLFKYFYKAGVEWLGAELMYGPIDVITASLRGSAKAYGEKSYGAHLAVQWSTTPHGTEERLRRYMIALFECFMNGYDQINTEEGLWRLEEMYADMERFSPECINHKKVQQYFYQFIQTHSRRGEQYIPISALHGKYDAWLCFTRPNAWMQSGDYWAFSEMESSWDLLKVFYPQSILDALYIHNAPNEPLGFYSKSLYGAIDILPVEAKQNVYGQYKFLFLLGYNSFDEILTRKLYDYVLNGGELLLGLSHLYKSYDRVQLLNNTSEIYFDENLKQLLGIDSILSIKKSMIGDQMIETGECIVTTALELENQNGIPTVLQNSVGKGHITFINIAGFPSSKNTKEQYEKYLYKIAERIKISEYETGWIHPQGYVNFTTYKNTNSKIFYLLNINWWATENVTESAEFFWGTSNHLLQVHHNHLGILTVGKNLAIYTNDKETDVIKINEYMEYSEILIQGQELTYVTIFLKNKDENQKIVLSSDCLKNVEYLDDRIVIEVRFDGVSVIRLNY